MAPLNGPRNSPMTWTCRSLSTLADVMSSSCLSVASYNFVPCFGRTRRLVMTGMVGDDISQLTRSRRKDHFQLKKVVTVTRVSSCHWCIFWRIKHLVSSMIFFKSVRSGPGKNHPSKRAMAQPETSRNRQSYCWRQPEIRRENHRLDI